MEMMSDLFFSEKYGLFRNAAAILGAVFVGRLIVRHLYGLVSGFRAFFLAPMGIGRLNLRKYGEWAVVTGASQGIGKAYAIELAKSGLNVVLMSRSEEKLNKVATEIKEKYGRDTRVIPVDFSDGFEIYASLAKQIDSLDIGVLVNNVGIAPEYPDIVGDVPPERLYKMVRINCHAVVQMSRILLPRMTAKGGGVIVNISSIASVSALPELSVYSATKIYVNYVSEGLRKEYRRKGIIVQNVTPLFVVTPGMESIVRPSFLMPNGATFAKSAIATIGVQNNTFGYFFHAIQGYIATRVPKFMFDSFLISGAKSVMPAAKAKTN